MMVRRAAILTASSVLALALGQVPAPRTAVAGNTPIYRDCSLLLEGEDPDFVQLGGATITPQGTLTVSATTTSLVIEASESNSPADQTHHVTFNVKISAPGRTTQTVFGAGTGKVFLILPLANPVHGLTYTLAWQAVFDNGLHYCPGLVSPQNRIFRHPFLVTVT